MAENENTPEAPTDPPAAENTEQIPATPAPTPAPVPVAPSAGPRLRDTVWNFRSMLAVAAASLVIGGAAGGAIVGLASDDDGVDRLRITNMGDRMPGNGQLREWRQDGPR